MRNPFVHCRIEGAGLGGSPPIPPKLTRESATIQKINSLFPGNIGEGNTTSQYQSKQAVAKKKLKSHDWQRGQVSHMTTSRTDGIKFKINRLS